MSTVAVTMLASGSKGNAALIRLGASFFLIDLGLSCRELNKRLKQAGLAIERLQAVFITHHHNDHIKGLAAFLKNYTIPVYATNAAWREIAYRLNIPLTAACSLLTEEAEVAGVKVETFSVPHDALDTKGLRLSLGDEACVYISDAGCVTSKMAAAAEGAAVLVIEANHDVALLKAGSYPAQLKRRILGRRGHLANSAAADFVAALKRPPRTVILAHLSAENNRPALALQAMRDALANKEGVPLPNILVAAQDEIVGTELPEQPSVFPTEI